MEEILKKNKKGIHVSEIYTFIEHNKDIISHSTNTSFLSGIFQRSLSIASDKRNYLYLREWGESRRIDIKSALKQAFAEHAELSMSNLIITLPRFLGRTIDKLQINYGLRNIDATYNSQTNTWSLSNDLDDAEFNI